MSGNTQITQMKRLKREKKKTRIPLRVQIAGLLGFFVAVLGYISISSTISYLEQNKTAQVREIQNLQVSRQIMELGVLWQDVRLQLTEQAFRLIDSNRGSVALKDGWFWIKVGDKIFQAPGQKSNVSVYPAPPAKRELYVSPTKDGKNFYVFLPIDLKVAGQLRQEWALAEVARPVILGKDSVNRIGLQQVLLNVSNLQSGLSEKNIKEAVWMGTDKNILGFSSFFPMLLSDDRKAMLQYSQQAVSREVKTSSGEVHIVSWVSFGGNNPELQLTLFTFVDRESLLKSFRSFVVKQAFYAFLILGFGFIFAIVISRRLSRPVEDMANAAKILETGNFRARVKVDRADEIGDLANAFNHMGQALEERELALQEAQNTIIQNEKLAAIGTLSAGIAHEVKNPLAGILGNADLVANQIKKLNVSNVGPLLNYIEVIQKETKRCRGIIDSLMKFSRQEKATYGPMDLEVVVWETIQLLEHSLNMSGVQIEKDFAADLKMIEGNANQIEQTLLNMMQNAGHAMPKGGKIRLSTNFYTDPKTAPKGRFVALQSEKFQGAFCRITIADTGTGMSDEVVRKIFEPFFTTKPKGVGTGLGLAVTLGILSDHKARISIDTAPGQGTTFHLDFMATQERNQDIMHELEEIRKKAAGGAKVSTDISAPALKLASDVSMSPPISSGDEVTRLNPRPLPVPPPRPTGKTGLHVLPSFPADANAGPKTQTKSSKPPPPRGKTNPNIPISSMKEIQVEATPDAIDAGELQMIDPGTFLDMPSQSGALETANLVDTIEQELKVESSIRMDSLTTKTGDVSKFQISPPKQNGEEASVLENLKNFVVQKPKSRGDA